MEIKNEAGQRWVLQDENGQLVPTGTFLKSNRDEQEGRRFELLDSYYLVLTFILLVQC